MVTLRGRLDLALGWAEWDMADDVRVGDRMCPRRIDVTMPSTGDLPALTLVIEVRDGIPVCTQITITAKDDGRDVRSTDLHAVKIENWVEDIVAAVSARIVSDSAGTITAEYRHGEQEHRAAVETIRAARRGRRRSVTDDVLRKVAETYRQHLDDRPTEAVQLAFGTTYRTAGRYVQLARAAGLLPPTTPGKKRG